METQNILFCLTIALFAGLLLSRLAKKLKLPAVTAYLIAGVLIGPFCLGAFGVPGLGFISLENVEGFSIISDVALGFIAFSIGNEFRLSELKKIGKQATIIGILQAVITTLVVDAALIGLHFIIPDKFPIEAAIILGAIASATAPAATLMVVKQYKAHGPVTKTLLPVVALDDAVGLVLFAISFGIVKSLLSTEGGVGFGAIILEPIIEVVFSIVVGTVMGIVCTYIERFFHSRSKRLAVSVAFVLLTVAISMFKFPIGSIHVAFSPLLSCMMLGTIFCNICDFSAELMDRLDRWTAPIYVLFFVISGAELDLSVFLNHTFVIIGVVYIAFRCLGKYCGARFSSELAGAEPNVKKYLGITLFPQAGVALGMVNMVSAELGHYTNPIANDVIEIVLNIILFSVLVYEIVGPFLTKLSLVKAGEIDPEKQVSNRIKHHDKTIPTTKI
ncbi:MAG: cation:proton antiporter [Clostridia bacterium]|nr:cation:proton antiporter [Clostridia bacterium]